MTLRPARPEHKVAFEDIHALVNKHATKIGALELLAIAANMVGKLVALQDQRSVTVFMAMEIVAKNIQQGNEEALAQLSKPVGTA